MRMAGHHGNSKVTVENLQVVKVDVSNNQLLIKGAVPGSKNGTLIISK
jgi:large subunit ribosomal protein L3